MNEDLEERIRRSWWADELRRSSWGSLIAAVFYGGLGYAIWRWAGPLISTRWPQLDEKWIDAFVFVELISLVVLAFKVVDQLSLFRRKRKDAQIMDGGPGDAYKITRAVVAILLAVIGTAGGFWHYYLEGDPSKDTPLTRTVRWVQHAAHHQEPKPSPRSSDAGSSELPVGSAPDTPGRIRLSDGGQGVFTAATSPDPG